MLILRSQDIYGRATSKKIQVLRTSTPSSSTSRRGRSRGSQDLLLRVLPDSPRYTRLPRRSSSSSYFLLPEDRLPPLSAKPRFAQTFALSRPGCVFLAVFARNAKTAKNIAARFTAFRRGAFSGPCFLALFFFKILKKIKIYFLKK